MNDNTISVTGADCTAPSARHNGIGAAWIPFPESFAKAVWAGDYTTAAKASAAEVWACLFWLVKRASAKRRTLESAREIAGRLGWHRKTIGRLLGEIRAAWDTWNGRTPERHLCATQAPLERHPMRHGFDNVEEASATQAPPLRHLGTTTRGDLSLYCAQARPRVTALQALQTENLLHRPAGARDESPSDEQPEGTLLSAVAGSGRGKLWADLVRDLEAAGYATLEDLVNDGRDEVAASLGRAASASRLDRISACLERRGLVSSGFWTGERHTTGRPARKRAQSDSEASTPRRRSIFDAPITPDSLTAALSPAPRTL